MKETLATAVQIILGYYGDQEWLYRNPIVPILSNMKKTEIDFSAKTYVEMIRNYMDTDDEDHSLAKICDDLRFVSEDFLQSSIVDLKPSGSVILTFEDMCNARVEQVFMLIDYLNNRFFVDTVVRPEVSAALNAYCKAFPDKESHSKSAFKEYQHKYPEVHRIVKGITEDMRYFQPKNLRDSEGAKAFYLKVINAIETLQHLEVYFSRAYPDIDHINRTVLNVVDHGIVSGTEDELIKVYDMKESELDAYIKANQGRKKMIAQLKSEDRNREAENMAKNSAVDSFPVKKMFTRFSIPKLIISETMEPTSPLYRTSLRVKVKAALYRHYMMNYMNTQKLTHFDRESYDATCAHIKEAKTKYDANKKSFKHKVLGFKKKDIVSSSGFIPTQETPAQYLNFGPPERAIAAMILTEVTEACDKIEDPIVLQHVLALAKRNRDLKDGKDKPTEMQKGIKRVIAQYGLDAVMEMVSKAEYIQPAIEGESKKVKKLKQVIDEDEDDFADTKKPKKKPVVEDEDDDDAF